LPLLGEVTRIGGGPPGAASTSNSVQRLAAVHDAFAVPPDLAEALAGIDAPVLLVDDLWDTGWTMAAVTRLLRRQGAAGVLPLTLAMAG